MEPALVLFPLDALDLLSLPLHPILATAITFRFQQRFFTLEIVPLLS
jgi:hypothetical protein